jgi:ABC-type transport system involved in Fe-S cluster assembly fused permease/ATPase subunit
MSESNRIIITVLGSTKYRNEINQWALKRTKERFLVLFAPFAKEDIPNLEDLREELEIQHFQKIRMANLVFVYNKDKYIGDSTRLEIEYAKLIGKRIDYLEGK